MANVGVYTGFWVDHTYGPFQGATLTVPIRWGNYLIAFFTILISWAGISAWGIVSYFIHQSRALKREKDVLDLQLQVHLRSSASAADTLKEMFKLGMAWRKTGAHVWARVLSILLAAAITWSVFVASGILVANVATRNYNAIFVLAEPDICGTTVINITTPRGLDILTTKHKNDSRAAIAYAESWYHGEGSLAISASPFRSLTLPYNISTNEPCPFGGNTRCVGFNGTKGGAVVLDTGPLDSHLHLGINAPKSDRITYRRRVTCAPVAVKNFVSEIPTQPINNQSFLDVHIGPVGDQNVTFEWGVSSQFVSGYDVRAEWYTPPHSPWTPIPTFVIPDSDIIAIFLASNEMAYYDPVYDPMFIANGSHPGTLGEIAIYYPSVVFSIMICGDQHQICNPSSGVCSTLSGQSGISPDSSAIKALRMNAAQQAAVLRFYASTIYTGFYQTVNDLGAQALQAQNLVTDTTFSSGLPSNQWQIEASRWFEASLVKLQAFMLEWVEHSWVHGNEPEVKIRDPRTIPKEAGPDGDFTAAEQYQCHNQIIRSSAAVQNFSLVGIIIIVVISCFIIGLGVLLEPFIILYRKWSHSQNGMRKDLAQDADNKNTLLSLALDRAGNKAVWEMGLFGIPITKDRVHVPHPVRRPDGLVEYQFIEDIKHKAARENGEEYVSESDQLV